MPMEKMAIVEEIAQIRLTKEDGEGIAKNKEKQLNETENTLKFAVFCLAFNYFRSMSLIQREKASWNGKDSVAGVTKEVVEHTDERKRDRRAQERGAPPPRAEEGHGHRGAR